MTGYGDQTGQNLTGAPARTPNEYRRKVMRGSFRRGTAAAVGFGLAAVGLFGATAPAHATMRTAVELCPFGLSLNVTLDPPLKPTGGQSEAHGTGTLANCVGLPLGLKNAVIVGDGRATVGPTGQELTGTAAFVWSNGAVDHFTFTVSTDPVNPKFSAVVTDGPLAGDTATGIGPFVPATDASGSITGFTVTGATVTFLPV